MVKLMNDIYVYSNGVLRNKLGIKDENKLKQAESDFVIVRLKQILQSDEFDFSVKGYKRLHEEMFQDIYPFAGQIRKVDIYKNERLLSDLPMPFVPVKQIPEELKRCFKTYIKDFNDYTDKEKVEIIRNFMSSVWQVHPFREGNTRSIITYSLKYAKSSNLGLDQKLILDNFAYIRDALVMSAYNKNEYLDEILLDSVERGKNNVRY